MEQGEMKSTGWVDGGTQGRGGVRIEMGGGTHFIASLNIWDTTERVPPGATTIRFIPNLILIVGVGRSVSNAIYGFGFKVVDVVHEKQDSWIAPLFS